MWGFFTRRTLMYLFGKFTSVWNTRVEILQMCYWYTIIQFVCSSSTSAWMLEKSVTCNLRAPFWTRVFEILEMCYRYNFIQLVCSWSSRRKEIILKTEKKKIRHYIVCIGVKTSSSLVRILLIPFSTSQHLSRSLIVFNDITSICIEHCCNHLMKAIEGWSIRQDWVKLFSMEYLFRKDKLRNTK